MFVYDVSRHGDEGGHCVKCGHRFVMSDSAL